jgi:hypothetical protein
MSVRDSSERLYHADPHQSYAPGKKPINMDPLQSAAPGKKPINKLILYGQSRRLPLHFWKEGQRLSRDRH